MKRPVCLLSFLLLAAPALAQETPQPTSAIPITPAVLPPDVPPRPPLIAVPPSIEPAVDSTPSHKESLAWRARAHRLRQANTAQQVVLPLAYDAVIMNLIAALSQAGLRVQTLNSKAGELLAVPVDARSSQRFIFVFAEMPPGRVTVKAASWSQTQTSTALVQSILTAVDKQCHK